MIVRIGFFDHKSVEHVELRDLPLPLYADTVICPLVVNVVLADVLLDEGDVAVGCPVAVDGELADVVATVTFYLVIKDI